MIIAERLALCPTIRCESAPLRALFTDAPVYTHGVRRADVRLTLHPIVTKEHRGREVIIVEL
jgi:hypothetical protein